MTRTLTRAEIDAQLEQLPGWAVQEDALRRSIEFDSFMQAIAAVGRIADAAESMDHHPDIDIRWRTVNLGLRTHSAGGITQLDIELAHDINRIVDGR